MVEVARSHVAGVKGVAMTMWRGYERVSTPWSRAGGGIWFATLIVMLVGILLCHAPEAEAGWFVPENRIAWQAWRNGDDTLSLKHWDHSSEGMFGRATVLLSMGHPRGAARDFRQALAGAVGLGPAYIASIWYNLGNSLYAEGALQQARQAWHQALRYNPAHTKAAHNLAIVGDLLKGRRSRSQNANAASRMMQSRKREKSMHDGSSQGGVGLPVSGNAAETRKGGGNGDGGNVKNISQAEREVNTVHDSMGLFLRHRLSEKPVRAVPSRRGPPW